MSDIQNKEPEINLTASDETLISEDELTEPELEETDEDTELKKPIKAKAFVESSERADDMRSSGLAFFVVGLLMIVFAVCVYFNIIPMGTTTFQKTLNACIILALAIGFIAVSIYSTKKAKALNEKSISETRLTEEIVEYCVQNYKEPESNEEESENLLEETYFAREQFIRDMINSEFKGLTESYIDYLLDIIYTELFDESETE